MIIGVPKEIKNNENRVGMTPPMIQELLSLGHEVWIEKGAGVGSGFEDEEYKLAGATIIQEAAKIWDANMVVKVKEPLEPEYKYFRADLVIFCYLHLAPNLELAKALEEAKTTAIACETIAVGNTTPLLRPMSETAGRRSVVIGATYLEKQNGGKGILLSGLPGTQEAKVTIVGGGIAGLSAAEMAVGLGAKVTVLELNEDRLRVLKNMYGNKISVLKSNAYNLALAVKEADLLVSAILIPGEKPKKIVTEEMVKSMQKGSVIVDIAIDQGGSVETIDHVTTHDDPVFEKHGVIHYAVPNMPGAVARSATLGLTNATLSYILELANHGWIKACKANSNLATGLNVVNGHIVNPSIAKSQNKTAVDWTTLI